MFVFVSVCVRVCLFVCVLCECVCLCASCVLGVKNPDKRRKELVDDYTEKFANPYVAAARGFIDDVIDPRDTRPKIIRALQLLRNKSDSMPPKKHGNVPL